MSFVAGEERVGDEHRDDEHAREIFDAAITERETAARLAAHERERDPERRDRRRVAEVVDHVGQQRGAARHRDDDELDHADGEQQDARPLHRPQSALGSRDRRIHHAMRMVVVIVIRMIVAGVRMIVTGVSRQHLDCVRSALRPRRPASFSKDRRHARPILEVSAPEGQDHTSKYMRTLVVLARVLPFHRLVPARLSPLDLRRRLPAQTTREFHRRARNERLVRTVAELGPSFVKIAQVFAGRADLLPEPYLSAVSTLTDRVPPVPAPDIVRVIETAYARPLARAVHRLESGAARRRIARPGASCALSRIRRRREGAPARHRAHRRRATCVHRRAYSAGRSGCFRIRTCEICAQWSASSRCASAARWIFARRPRSPSGFARTSRSIRRSRCRSCSTSSRASGCSSLEYMPGLASTSSRRCIADGRIDAARLVRTVMELYVQMMLIDGLFHADPHPGNLLVREDGHVVLLDFGLVVEVPRSTRLALVRTVFAAIKRDANGVVDGFYALGIVASDVDRQSSCGSCRRCSASHSSVPPRRSECSSSIASCSPIRCSRRFTIFR